MNEITLSADPQAKGLFDAFVAEHPEQCEVVTGKAFDGTTVITLLVENAATLSASLAMLVAVVKGRNIKIIAKRDGVEVDISQAGKAN